ncbi:hypothetical protein L596_024964 [Steinernema carpocapsae]|uniref:Uncharacterized protein n=1 Tax=Steinernema carpocapsae TaxID=34508 RepID=A0A4V5ZYX6_STECR|nr:hypothetical protein L596_024964 [Steinernema carpocapsae]
MTTFQPQNKLDSCLGTDLQFWLILKGAYVRVARRNHDNQAYRTDKTVLSGAHPHKYHYWFMLRSHFRGML